MRWIFYILCFLLLGVNTSSADDIISQEIGQETFCATQLQHNYIVSPNQFVSEDLDSENFTPASGIIFPDHLHSFYSEKEKGNDGYSSARYSYFLSAWLIDLPPPVLVLK